MSPIAGRDRRSPAERVRDRLRGRLPERRLAELPTGYQRLGSVLVLDLPEPLRPSFSEIGEAWREVLGVRAVLRRAGPVEGELRRPELEPIAPGPTETTVLEHGVRFRFDAARVLFARGNREERHRIGRLVRPGEVVVDLFAGIGYFTLPALVTGRAARVIAVEKNPVSFDYLVENLRRNGVSDRAEPVLGDNRTVALPTATADRVVLGYLPTAVPWIGRALSLLSASGGAMHVHLLVGTREGPEGASELVRSEVERLGRGVDDARGRRVKRYGPGRDHMVVDVAVRARTGASG